MDALAPGADEGRGKLRKGTGKSKHLEIRTYPYGATRQVKTCHPEKGGRPGELKHLSTRRKRNQTRYPE